MDLDELKRELRITWPLTPEEECLLAQQKMDAEGVLIQKHRNVAIDFNEDKAAKRLLVNLIRYIRSDAEAEFYKDYKKQLNELYLRAKVPPRGDADAQG